MVEEVATTVLPSDPLFAPPAPAAQIPIPRPLRDQIEKHGYAISDTNVVRPVGAAVVTWHRPPWAVEKDIVIPSTEGVLAGSGDAGVYVANKPAVTSLGRYRNENGHIYFPVPGQSQAGYCQVKVSGDHYMLHCLEAHAFGIPRCQGQHVVDHIDRDRSDNRIIKLRYATHSENSLNTDRSGSMGGSITSTELFTLDGEEWVVCYGGYMVSNFGRWRTKDRPNKSYTPRPSKQASYAMVGVVRGDGKLLTLRFLRIVGECFVPKPQAWTPAYVIDHLDGNKCNNAASNLEWVTGGENTRRAKARSAEADAHKKLVTSKPVEGRMRDSPWLRFDSAKDAAKVLGLTYPGIAAAAKRGNTTWHGTKTWMWRYAPNPASDLLPGEEIVELTDEILKKTREIGLRKGDGEAAVAEALAQREARDVARAAASKTLAERKRVVAAETYSDKRAKINKAQQKRRRLQREHRLAAEKMEAEGSLRG